MVSHRVLINRDILVVNPDASGTRKPGLLLAYELLLKICQRYLVNPRLLIPYVRHFSAARCHVA
jgi:hypothetical protein